ncbi:MAG: hypothetical protein KME10_15710 [Plectolyngbya sp. WJT66-NPBG17]|jgi:hypothetical protein|nr:hypothetical protein [Plectolyngbya sp. WJT66-NPBG17]MBW4526073.1 hypothetical protein [Phormidium tanganyikae FI6-MK23]
MDWFISLNQFEELVTARPSPPYVLLLSGLFITLACAIPFAIAVRQRIKYWSKYLSPDTLPTEAKLQIIVPFSGMVGGFYIALAAELEVLGLPVLPSLILALIVTFLAGYLAWFLLGRALSRRAVRSYLEQSFGADSP